MWGCRSTSSAWGVRQASSWSARNPWNRRVAVIDPREHSSLPPGSLNTLSKAGTGTVCLSTSKSQSLLHLALELVASWWGHLWIPLLQLRSVCMYIVGPCELPCGVALFRAQTVPRKARRCAPLCWLWYGQNWSEVFVDSFPCSTQLFLWIYSRLFLHRLIPLGYL